MSPPPVSVLDRAAAASPRSDSGSSPALDLLIGDWNDDGGPAWAVVVGLQDPALARALQQRVRRLLLVQANPRLAERLGEEWPAGLPPGVRLCMDPVGATAAELSWYRYNDPRLDGPLAPAELGPRYRNLTLLAEERRRQRPLADLVHEWWREDGEPEGDGALLLQGTDPGPALEGALALLPRLEWLVFWQESGGRRTPAEVPQELAAQLTQACFQTSKTEASRWQLDERLQLRQALADAQTRLADQKAELQQQERSLQARTLQVEELAESGRALAAQRDELANEAQELLAVRGSLEQEREALRQQLEALQEQGASLTQERDCLTQERDGLAAHGTSLNAECQSLASEREAQQRQIEGLTLQQEGLRATIEALTMEREADLRSRSELERQRDLAAQERDILQAAQHLAIEQREDLEAQVSSLAVRCRALQESLEKLQQELAQCAQERDSFHAAHDVAVGQRDELDGQRSLLEDARDALEQRLQGLQLRLDGLETERDLLRQERDALQEQTQQRSLAHEKAEQQLQQWEGRAKQWEAESAESSHNLVELQRERHGLWELRDSLNQQNRSLSERIDALEASNTELLRERQTLLDQGDLLRGEVEALAGRCREQEQGLRGGDERQRGLEAEVEQLREALRRAEEERDTFHVAHDLALRQAQEHHEQLQSLREEAEQQRRSQAEQSRADAEELQAENGRLQAEIAGQQGAIAALQQRQEELERLTADSERQLALIRDLFVQVSTARGHAPA
jgi:chromosome segregation ATPase